MIDPEWEVASETWWNTVTAAVADSFTADAVVLASQTTSLTADATIQIPQVSSVAADAVIKCTLEYSRRQFLGTKHTCHHWKYPWKYGIHRRDVQLRF